LAGGDGKTLGETTRACCVPLVEGLHLGWFAKGLVVVDPFFAFGQSLTAVVIVRLVCFSK
jgi:hypothetical protein